MIVPITRFVIISPIQEKISLVRLAVRISFSEGFRTRVWRGDSRSGNGFIIEIHHEMRNLYKVSSVRFVVGLEIGIGAQVRISNSVSNYSRRI